MIYTKNGSKIEKKFTNKKVSKFDLKQYRLLKFQKRPILKLSGVLHTFEGGGPISAIGKLPFGQENLPRTMPLHSNIVGLDLLTPINIWK